jgi:hypothetical protein
MPYTTLCLTSSTHPSLPRPRCAEVPSIVASDGMSSGPASDRQNSPSGSRKRRSTSRFIEADDPEPMHHVGSPVSTMHLSAGKRATTSKKTAGKTDHAMPAPLRS